MGFCGRYFDQVVWAPPSVGTPRGGRRGGRGLGSGLQPQPSGLDPALDPRGRLAALDPRGRLDKGSHTRNNLIKT